MVRYVGRGMRAVVCALAVMGVLVGPAAAKSPGSPGAPTTGVAVPSGGKPATIATGVPAGYAALKASQLAAVAAGKSPAQAVVHGNKMGPNPMTVTPNLGSACVGSFPCAFSILNSFPNLHEMQPYFCVVAWVQSVAVWDLGSYYLTMGTGSQLGGQNVLYSQLNGGIYGLGVYDPYALSWINSKFSSAGYPFYYVAVKPSTIASFMYDVRFDLAWYYETNYVRVNLAYGYYGGFGSGGLHATGTLAYSDTAGTVTSYDPYSLRSSDGSCANTSYSYSQTKGCSWTMSQTRYFLAMDTGSNDGTSPVWY